MKHLNIRIVVVLALLCGALCGYQHATHAQEAEAPVPFANTRLIYVSPDGDDANDGLSPDKAVKTPEQGIGLLRADQPDWLLFQRGFDYEIKNSIGQPRGAAASTPLVISSYGKGSVPTLDVGSNAEKFNQTQRDANHILVYSLTIVGLDGQFPTLTPGTGWTGSTPQPSAAGDPSKLGYDAKAMARWDVVPYQTFDDEFHVGVVAFHMNGIDRVSFSVEGGEWVDVSEMQQNPRTNVHEYVVSLDASLFKEDGVVEVRAIAWPVIGEPRVLAGEFNERGENSLWLNVNHSGNLLNLKAYVSPQGSDEAGDGSSAKPYRSIMKAARSIQDEQGDSADGGVIYLLPGEHTYGDYASSLYTKTKDRWLTITPAPGVASADAPIRFASSSDGLRTKLVRLYNLTITPRDDTQLFSSNGPLEDYIWVQSCWLEGRGNTVSERWLNSWTGVYFTDSSLGQSRDGISGELVRNVKIRSIGSDAFTNSGIVIDCHVAEIDRGDSGFHPDIMQLSDIENVIVYGVSSSTAQGQGFFAGSNKAIKDVAFVNCDLDNQKTETNANIFQFAGPTNHMYVRDSAFNGPTSWRYDLGFVPRNVVLENVELSDSLDSSPPKIIVR